MGRGGGEVRLRPVIQHLSNEVTGWRRLHDLQRGGPVHLEVRTW